MKYYLYPSHEKGASKPISWHLENDFTKCPCDGGTRGTSNVYYDMAAHIEAVASVLASFHPIRREPVLGDATWINACVTLTITDGWDTQAKRWAAFQISHERNEE